MTGSVVELGHAVVRRQGAAALDDVCLSLAPGECVGVIGPNGAGKTTLLQAVNGMAPLASGTVSVLGGDPHHSREGHRLRARIGYVAQAQEADPRMPMTVYESVAAGRLGRLGWFGRMGRADHDIVRGALEWAGLARLADRPLGRLSGGELQRTAIARALAQEPELLLLDEPTASIDPAAERELLRLLDELPKRTGAAMIYVTHDLATLPECCARLVLMRRGRVWRSGPRAAMLDHGLLQELYGGRAPSVSAFAAV